MIYVLFYESGHAREAGDAVDGTGCAGVRGHARSHSGAYRILFHFRL